MKNGRKHKEQEWIVTVATESQSTTQRVLVKKERNQAAKTEIQQEIGLEIGLTQEIEYTVLEQNTGTDLTLLQHIREKRKKEKAENIVLDAVGTQVLTTTLETDLKKGQETDVKEENTVRSMSQGIETDPEKEKDAPEPLAQNVEEVKTNPAMGEGEGTAKRP